MIDNSIKYKPAGNSRQQQFMLRLWSNLLVHLGINKKMKIFGGGGIIRQLLRLTTVSLAGCLHSSSSICTTSPEHLLVVVVATITYYYYYYLASSQSVDIIITGATTLNQHASKKTRNKRRRRAWQIKVTNLSSNTYTYCVRWEVEKYWWQHHHLKFWLTRDKWFVE